LSPRASSSVGTLEAGALRTGGYPRPKYRVARIVIIQIPVDIDEDVNRDRLADVRREYPRD
jgi:hypothetical protein